MSGLVLTAREAAGPPIDMTGVRPGGLAGLTLIRGRDRHRLEDLFTLSGDEGADRLILRPDGAVLHGVGAGMTAGDFHVEGDCGEQAGCGMRGGTLTVEGRCGAFAAAEMAGGRLRIAGDAGDFLGAPLAGGTRGMSGGSVIVGGNAGDRVGERMRRGLIAVHGGVGDLCAVRMIAGSIVVGGGCGAGLGLAMRRGSILLSRMPTALPDGFADGGVNDWLFLELMRRELSAAGAWPPGLPPAGNRARRLLGDRSVTGIGEILILSET